MPRIITVEGRDGRNEWKEPKRLKPSAAARKERRSKRTVAVVDAAEAPTASVAGSGFSTEVPAPDPNGCIYCGVPDYEDRGLCDCYYAEPNVQTDAPSGAEGLSKPVAVSPEKTSEKEEVPKELPKTVREKTEQTDKPNEKALEKPVQYDVGSSTEIPQHFKSYVLGVLAQRKLRFPAWSVLSTASEVMEAVHLWWRAERFNEIMLGTCASLKRMSNFNKFFDNYTAALQNTIPCDCRASHILRVNVMQYEQPLWYKDENGQNLAQYVCIGCIDAVRWDTSAAKRDWANFIDSFCAPAAALPKDEKTQVLCVKENEKAPEFDSYCWWSNYFQGEVKAEAAKVHSGQSAVGTDSASPAHTPAEVASAIKGDAAKDGNDGCSHCGIAGCQCDSDVGSCGCNIFPKPIRARRKRK